jgi:clusterin-associated protein 1
MDGAVNEILKITSYLIDCVHLQTSHRQATGKRHGSFRKESSSLVDLVDMENVQNLRKFMTQLIEEGSNLYSSIMKHIDTEKQNEYHNAIDYFQNVSNTLNEKDEDFIIVQEKLHEIVESKKQELLALEDDTSLLHAKLGDAREALKNESRELERSKKRLQSLQSIEPTFMTEIDKLEADLQNHYDLYMERYRNLHYLKSEMEKIKRIETDIVAESERRMKMLQLKLYEDDKQSHLESITDFGKDYSIVSPNQRNDKSIRDKQFQLDEDLSEEKSGQSSEHSSSILISTGSTSSPSMGSEMFFSDNESPRHFHSNFHQYTTRKSESDDDNF